MRPTAILAPTLALLACARTTTRAAISSVAPSHPPPPAAAAAPAITTREQLLQAMRDRYAGTWYRQVTFVQHNIRPLPTGAAEHTTGLEAMQLPGKLRIDLDSVPRGNAILFARDTQYIFQNRKLVQTIARPHPLLLLGFDVYALPVSQTAATLRALAVDLGTVHQDAWQGRPVYVVGARAGDLHTRQFWIDQDRLVFVRMLEPAPRDSTKTNDTRFNDYRRLGGGWIAPEVEFYRDGQLAFREEYEDIRVDVPLDSTLFEPARFSSAVHWWR